MLPSMKSFIRTLYVISGGLVLMHILGSMLGPWSWQIERIFHLGYEENVPTWFASVLWLTASYFAFQCGRLSGSGKNKRGWYLFAVVFMAFSLDEVSMLHENLFRILESFLPLSWQAVIEKHFWASDWGILAFPFVLVAVVFLGQLIRSLFKEASEAKRLITAGFALVILGGWGLELTINWMNHDSLEWLWQLETVAEESCELFGTILIISGLLQASTSLRDGAHALLSLRDGAQSESKQSIRTDSMKVIPILFAITAALVVSHLIALGIGKHVWQWERMFHLGRESNVPTWFSSSLHLIAALLAYFCSAGSGNLKEKKTWTILAAGFLYLSCDEVAMLHESFDRILLRLIGPGFFEQSFSVVSWPVLLSPLLLLAVIWLGRNLKNIFKDSAEAFRLFALGAVLFLFGAIGLELTNNLVLVQQAWWIQNTEIILEEGLEMTGSIFMIAALFTQLQHQKECAPVHAFT